MSDQITPAEEQEGISVSLTELEKDVFPIVEDVSKHTRLARRAVGTDPVDTLGLSNEIIELSILNQRLGDRAADAAALARWAKEFYERVRENYKVKLVKGYTKFVDGKSVEVSGVAAGVADSMKLEKAHASFDIYNDCQRHSDRLANLRRSTDKTIDSLRTKISYEKINERNA